MNVIRFEEAMQEALSGLPVKLKFVTFDQKRKTGGQIREMQAVATRPTNVATEKNYTTPGKSAVANHKEHFTRSFFECIESHPTSVIRKVHMELLLEVNGKKVML